ncbi:AAA family ATPase [Desemzia sp. FAM 24101]|uniref:AAA family ATPase n=1 Tax=unclassified Desemzia TaxID=2685243 RepID=UPI0038870FBB
MLNLNKVTVFIGPKSHFELQVTERLEDYSTLSEIVEVLIAISNTTWHKVEGQETPKQKQPTYKNLVCFSDEFNGISENLLLSFFSRISKLNIENVYMQNPPQKIYEQAKELKINFKKIEYKYNQLTEENLIDINDKFELNIIGQREAKKEILISLVPLLNAGKSKPVVIMLYGPTGVGKTETAKFIGEILGGKFFRQQLSMFQNQRAHNFLFGGEQGTDSLSYELVNRESNVILLDEFDKVDPSLYSAFYEVFDEGIFKDVLYKVNLKNSIIICTSNFRNLNDFKKTLGASIYSRFDNFIEYKPLSIEDKMKIINLKIDELLNSQKEEDKKKIRRDIIFKIMIGRLDKLDNVREINKDIEKLISLQLLDAILKK